MIVVAIIAFLFGLCLIISIHELGHFMFAKKYNVLCYEYSIGMGPLLYGKKKGETLYGLRAVPLGGYVAMADGAMANDFITNDMELGLNLDENNLVSEIIFNKSKESQIYGKVIDRDVYCEDGKTPFITLSVDGIETKYDVKKDAMMHFKPKKEMQIATYDRCFESKNKRQRFIMLFAGPGMNFILAIFLFIIAGLFIGKASNKPIIGSLDETIKVQKKDYASPAYAAGLRKGDKIIKVNDKEINNWDEISIIDEEVLKSEILTVDITYERDGNTLSTTIRPIIYIGNLGVVGNFEEHKDATGAEVFIYTTKAEKNGIKNYDVITKIDDTEIKSWNDLVTFCLDKENNGKKVNVYITRDGVALSKALEVTLLKESTVKKIKELEVFGAKIGITPKYNFNFFYSFVYAFKSFGKSAVSVWNTLVLLFSSRDVKVSDLSGPIGIYTLIKNSLVGGFTNYIYFLGFLSVNIGIVNLLPIPALDGGRIVLVGVEAVTRKKINKKVEDNLTTIVFFLLIGLLLYISFNDILRLR